MLKRIIAITCMVILLSTTLIFATTETASQTFADVSKDYWAYNEIMIMSENGIMNGDKNGNFRPEEMVSRAQFAKILVDTLDLPIQKTSKSTFKDIKKNHWASLYVESAKFYLTGYKNKAGNYFKPNESVTKEDMAVALVKALKYDSEPLDENILNTLSDKDKISKNLRKYVSIALKHDIMKADAVENSQLKQFAPKSAVSRAYISVLMSNLVEEEKITFDKVDDEKVTYPKDEQVIYPKDEQATFPKDEQATYPKDGITTSGKNDNKPTEEKTSDYTAPTVTVTSGESKLFVNWQVINDVKLQGYKVVISKNNKSPKYPDDGYLYWITDKNINSAYIDNSSAYNGGDFGKYLVPGQEYYVSVTAVYNDKNVAGNTVLVTYPEKSTTEGNTVSVTYPGKSTSDENKTESSSKNVTEPTAQKNRTESSPQNVTEPTSDKNKTESLPKKVTELTAKVVDGKLVLNWNKVSSSEFCYYKVVISKSNTNPKYPEDGYLEYFTDVNKTSTIVDTSKSYNGGDFGGCLESGQEYYFSITAVYNDGKIAGNVIQVKLP